MPETPGAHAAAGAVFFDVGGVLLRPQPSPALAAWEQRLGLGARGAERTIYHSRRGAAAASGAVSDDELWQEVAREHGLADGERDAFRRAVLEAYRPDEGVLAVVRALRPRWRTGVISNAPSSLRGALEGVYGVAGLFDLIVCSAEEGLLKPDPEIYRRALGRLGIAPAAAVLVDDRPDNVESARRLGMRAVLYPPELGLAAALARVGVAV